MEKILLTKENDELKGRKIIKHNENSTDLQYENLVDLQSNLSKRNARSSSLATSNSFKHYNNNNNINNNEI